MPFSFVHASDLHLGASLFAVADLPDELRGRILAARFDAARRLFDLAIREQVDALILAGGVIAPSAGPRAMAFFADQCKRLEAARIDVVWAESESDRRWSDFVPLPNNVCFTGSELGQTYESSRGGRSVAQVFTADSSGTPLSANRELPRIGILLDATRMPLPRIPSVDYWALGGRSLPGAIPSEAGLAQFAGTTQGASPEEPGPRGCMLVHLDDDRRPTPRFVPTASFDWREVCLNIDQDADWESVRSELQDRIQSLARTADDETVLVRWVLRGHGLVWQQLLRDDVNLQLLRELRAEFSATRPVWSLFVEAVADETQQDGICDAEYAVTAFRMDRRSAFAAIGGIDRAHPAGREPHFGHSHERSRQAVARQ